MAAGRNKRRAVAIRDATALLSRAGWIPFIAPLLALLSSWVA